MTLPLTNPVAIFLLVLAIILATPLLFARIKIPRIVGLIVAGIVVGPYGFNLLARDASFEIFGQVGILYLMFMAAIEIDMYHLKRNVGKGVFFGLLTFALPMGFGILVSRMAFGAGWDTCILLSSMYASHTLISYPIASRFGVANHKAAIIAVCGTIIAVLLALLALAEVVQIKINGVFGWWGVARLLCWMAAYALSVGYAFPIITRWFFRKFSDSVTQFIFILAMVFIASLFASLIGLEAILGAFYAGLILNRFVPARSALMRNMDFVGNAIFIPYFLIGVGMLINVHVILQGWGVVTAAAVMTITALTFKWIAAFITQKTFRLNPDARRLIFGLSSGKAAATIAATMIGYQYGLLNEDMMNGAVIMILICCIVASFLTERASKKIKIEMVQEELDADTSHSPGFARQIVAVSNPFTAEGLMKTAVFMRNPRNREPLTALYVRSSDDSSAVTMGHNALSIASQAAQGMDIPVNEMERFDLNIVAGLTNTLREKKATDIVIGLHRKSNIVDSFFGGMIENLLRQTSKMIIMVRCFIPVDTLRKLVVYVPQNAEYERGFHAWLARVGNLSSQLGCRTVFISYPSTAEYIGQFVKEEKMEFEHEFRFMESWDDFIILSSQAGEEDMMIVVGARKGSISYDSDMETMPSFIGKHFIHHNIAMIYPEQFG